MDFDLKRRLLLKVSPPSETDSTLWIHCASVGEFNTVKPVLRELIKEFSIVLTYFSPRAKKYIEAVEGFYNWSLPLPLDIPFLIRRFENIFNPKALVIVERELWFSLIRFTRCKKILINAYAKGNFIERLLIPKYSLILARTEKDKEVFLKEGAKKVKVCGNLKLVQEEFPRLGKRKINVQGKILVAGSTHKGEEEKILRIFKVLRKEIPLKLVIAPRHISRAEEVLNISRKMGFRSALRTSYQQDWEVLVLDTLGELKDFYHLADVTFVGGTLIPLGGHNLLEPAFFGKPVIFGTYTSKVKDIEELLIKKGYGFKIRSEEEFTKVALYLLKKGFKPSEDFTELAHRVKECYLWNIFSELKQLP